MADTASHRHKRPHHDRGETGTVDTTLEVSLSSALQDTLGKPGVSAYAVHFAPDAATGAVAPVWTELVRDGAIAGQGRVDIPLTRTVDGSFEGMDGGKIYLLIQSGSAGTSDLTRVITRESDINWGTARSHDFRYDSIEVTLENSSFDVANLTSINGFGLPMQLAVAYDDDTSASRGYSVSAGTLFGALDAASTGRSVETYRHGPLAGQDRMAASPAVALAEGLSAYSVSDWSAYVETLRTGGAGISLSGFFDGAVDANGIYHNAGYYAYTLGWSTSEQVFRLTPDAASQIQGEVQLTAEDLANSIYATLGNAGVYAPGSATPYRIEGHGPITDSAGDAATMNTGENNQWGAMLSQFITGFTAGYYGSSATSLNPGDDTVIDLDSTINWDPTYAFGAHSAAGAPTFYDHYSRAFFGISNSYGSGYTDALMSEYARGGPLMPVTEPGSSPARNVSKIALTLYDDGEMPAGYTPTRIYNHIAAPDGGYATTPAGTTNTSAASVGLSFHNAGMILKDGTQITVSFLRDTGHGGAPVWDSVTIDPGAGGTLWQQWDIGVDNGRFTVTDTAIAKDPGYLLLANFPGVEAGVHWTRITVGDPDQGPSKSFNLYTTTDGTGFANPAHAGQEGALAVDGLAMISPASSTAQGIITFDIDFLHAATSTLPPGLLEVNLDRTNLPVAAAPVVGMLEDGVFTGLGGQTSKSAPTATATRSELAFGWTGDNDMHESAKVSTEAWIAEYSNKIGALNTARIGIHDGKGALVTHLTTTADLDGQWTTGTTRLFRGDYTVTMEEFLGDSTAAGRQIGTASYGLTLTVDPADMDLSVSRGGQALALVADGEEAGGNWLRVETIEAAAAPGATVAIVVTDAAGALLDARTGAGGQVTLADATLATIGGLAIGAGGQALAGTQSVFLARGQHLGFVALDAGGMPEEDRASVRAAGDGRLAVQVGDHALRVVVDNDGSGAAMLATAQRQTGEPLVYVAEGQRIAVDVAGETSGANRLGFVRVEPVDGAWTVGGLAPGADGFDAALRAALDGGFRLGAEGRFAARDVWTVSDGAGFYAPVLETRDGTLLFAPAENGDAGDGDALRILGQNLFAFEDGAGARDFDDLTLRLTPVPVIRNGALEGRSSTPLVLDGRTVVEEGTRFLSDPGAGAGPGAGLGLLAEAGAPARLAVLGTAVFGGGAGVSVSGGDARVIVGEAGRLVLRGEGTVLGLDGAMTGGGDPGRMALLNRGVIRGDVDLGHGDDVVRGGGLFDGEVRLRGGHDLFLGGEGADVVQGNRGGDILAGGGGDDRLFGGGGHDVLAGGAGRDLLSGGRGNDILRGGSHDDLLSGGRGDDLLFGGRGDDVLRGGAGDDVLRGNRGADQLDGGRGDDILRGGAGADTLLGGAGADDLQGGRGDDVLRGGLHDDRLRGGAGDDLLFGGGGDDFLFGGPGDDVLTGGRGDDVLVGGAGADVFVLTLRNGEDRVRDFDPGRDAIDLTAYGLDPATAADRIGAAFRGAETGGAVLDLDALGGRGALLLAGLGGVDLSEVEFIL